ncbi:putative ApaG domain-containing protein [Helianthus debilis subsp. tardiflorus]
MNSSVFAHYHLKQFSDLTEEAQLYRRHWIIKSNDNVVGDFNGEAVIGQFPLLQSMEKEFVYEC